jgi:hypothetical protein
MNGGVPHAWNADPFPAQIFHRADIAFGRCLNPQDSRYGCRR